MPNGQVLDLRVKRIDEGISAAKACINLAPEYADGYLLLGLLQREKGLKQESIENLKKGTGVRATPVPKNISSNNFIGFHAPVNEIKLSDKHLADSNNSK